MGVVVFSGGSVAGAQPWTEGGRREVPTHDVFDVCGGGGKGLGAHGGVVVFSGISVGGAQPCADGLINPLRTMVVLQQHLPH